VCTLAVKKRIRAGFDMSDRTIPLLVIKPIVTTVLRVTMVTIPLPRLPHFDIEVSVVVPPPHLAHVYIIHAR
jgi:hypothetical protein